MDTSSIYHLPEEIIELILSRCPAKSVIKFKSVSKSWQSIISNPHFSRSLQSKLSENQSKLFILARPQYKDFYDLHLIRLEDGKFRRESPSRYPFGEFVVPLCSCDGLILIRENFDKYMLWNPFIRKHIIVPTFKPTDTYAYPHHCHLYRDSITEDYKIVFFYGKCYTVYSCKSGSWGEIKDFPCDWYGDGIISRACVDGCLYGMWCGSSEITYFDARDGKLQKLQQPKGVGSLVGVQLEAVSGRLCLYGFCDYREEKLQLWVMEETGKCWRELISMQQVIKSYDITNLFPICLSNEDDVVLWGTEYGMHRKHFMYNSRHRSFQEINFDFTWENSAYFRDKYFSYSENLSIPCSNICNCSSDSDLYY